MVCAVTTHLSWSQLTPGVVVEKVGKYSEAEKAGLQQGDVLIGWTRGDTKGEIDSPFELSLVEIEQAPRGDVTLQGFRNSGKRTWVIGPDDWGLRTRPQLPENLLALYLEAERLAELGKNTEAAERWRIAAVQAQESAPAWLSVWLLFHAGEQLAGVRQWKEADSFYQKALQQGSAFGPETKAQLLRAWALSYEIRGDFPGAGKYYEQAVAENQKRDTEDLFTASDLEILANSFRRRSQVAKAEEYCNQALTIQQKLAPGSLAVAHTLATQGLILFSRGDLTNAEDDEQRALAIQEKLAPGSMNIARTLYHLGLVSYSEGELERAVQHEQQALAIQQERSPGGLDVSATLITLGLALYYHGDVAKAQESWVQALTITENVASGSIYSASPLGNLGMVAWFRGDLARAEDYYRRAVAIQQRSNPGSLNEAANLANLGGIARDRGDDASAEKYLLQALAIQKEKAPDYTDTEETLDSLGDICKDRGDLTKAEEYYEQALAIQQKKASNSLHLSDTLSRLGAVACDRGDLVKAEDYDRQALRIREKEFSGSESHANALADLAGVLRRRGQPETAEQLYEQALNVLDTQVTRLGGGENASSGFRAKHVNYYKDYIDLLIGEQKPEIAFQVLEQLHARTLLQILDSAHVDIRKGVDPSLVEQERTLQESFSIKSQRRIQMLSDRHTEKQLSDLNKQIDDVLNQYYEVEERIRAGSPGYAALTQPHPLNAKDVQQQLLDADTLLLEYSLGEERSHVFAVTPDSLTVHELPSQSEIEALARKVGALLTARTQGRRSDETPLQKKARLAKADAQYAKAIQDLAELLLRPVAPQLGGKRLLIVSDGALQFIPFSILPEPAGSSRSPVPLMVGHEIVNLPSASVLAILRRVEIDRKRPPKVVAVLADPVFSELDARVVTTRNPKQAQTRSVSASQDTAQVDISEDPVTRSARDLGFLSLPRLPFTRQEADAISAVVPAGGGLKAVDFKANRELSISPELANYRMVHFATHGLIDSEHPELSGLVLSLVDKQGTKQNGFLGLEDIYNLDLPVDMVVLSACETGLGKAISGEGLIGLTRGFMYAGASRVVASLWSVDDEATAELMGRFYKEILRHRLPPAAALRQAQVEMWRQIRWRHPYYWGAFVMQGEWKPANGQNLNEHPLTSYGQR
jgi:CHAT domain-containing protein/Flp pilus assembly protein TadD